MSFEAKTVTEGNAREIADWCGGMDVVEHDPFDHSKTRPGVNVPVGPARQMNVKRASLGDTVLQHSDGTFEVLRNREKGQDE